MKTLKLLKIKTEIDQKENFVSDKYIPFSFFFDLGSRDYVKYIDKVGNEIEIGIDNKDKYLTKLAFIPLKFRTRFDIPEIKFTENHIRTNGIPIFDLMEEEYVNEIITDFNIYKANNFLRFIIEDKKANTIVDVYNYCTLYFDNENQLFAIDFKDVDNSLKNMLLHSEKNENIFRKFGKFFK